MKAVRKRKIRLVSLAVNLGDSVAALQRKCLGEDVEHSRNRSSARSSPVAGYMNAPSVSQAGLLFAESMPPASVLLACSSGPVLILRQAVSELAVRKAPLILKKSVPTRTFTGSVSAHA